MSFDFDDDDDFPSGGGSKGIKELEAVEKRVNALADDLKKRGLKFHFFITSDAEKTSDGMLCPAMCVLSMSPMTIVTHYFTLMRDKNYIIGAIVALALYKKGKFQFKLGKGKTDKGAWSKVKGMFN